MATRSEIAKRRSPWTDERVELLKQLYETRIPCSQIAVEINKATGTLFSRQAVIAQVHRQGLPLRGNNFHAVSQKSRATRVRPRPRNRPELVQAAALVIPDSVEPKHISIMLLNNKTCRWPYGDGPFTFCGCEVLMPPYCYAHQLMSTGRGTASEQRATHVSENLPQFKDRFKPSTVRKRRSELYQDGKVVATLDRRDGMTVWTINGREQ